MHKGIFVLRRRFIQSILGLVGLATGPAAAGAVAQRRTVLLQTSPVAGFQYHKKLSARIIALNGRGEPWEWAWERVRFEILL